MILLSNNKDLKDLIVMGLGDGPSTTTAILNQIRKKRPHVTKQGFYLALKQLLKKEVIVKHKTEIAANLLFFEKIRALLNKIDSSYIGAGNNKPLLANNTDRLIYKFNSLFSLDAYMMNIFSLIMGDCKQKSPLYLYNPFEWFLLVKPEAEIGYYNWIIDKGKTIYLILGNNATLNKTTIKKYSNKNLIIAIDDKTHFKENEFIIVLGDYIIVTKFSKKLSLTINNICKINNIELENAQKKVSELLSGKIKAKVIIEKNDKKAIKYKKILSKQLYVPRELINL